MSKSAFGNGLRLRNLQAVDAVLSHEAPVASGASVTRVLPRSSLAIVIVAVMRCIVDQGHVLLIHGKWFIVCGSTPYVVLHFVRPRFHL